MEFFDEKEVKIIASSVIDLILESSSSESELDNDSENEDFGNVQMFCLSFKRS